MNLSFSLLLTIQMINIFSNIHRIGGGGALSSISLLIERAPHLSNSLHTIYFVPLLIVFLYCINFSVSLY